MTMETELQDSSLQESLKRRYEMERGLVHEIVSFNSQADGLNMDSEDAVRVLVRRIIEYLDEQYGIL